MHYVNSKQSMYIVVLDIDLPHSCRIETFKYDLSHRDSSLKAIKKCS